MCQLKEISIEVTNACPQKCRHCSSMSGQADNEEISLPAIYKLLSEAKDLGADIFTISGGEPLVHPDIEEIISFARFLGYRIYVQTSGITKSVPIVSGIPESFFDFFSVNMNSHDKIVYSMHGLLTTHEYITGIPNSFSKLIYSIITGISKKIPTEIHSVLFDCNVEELDGMAFMFHMLQVDSWHMMRLVKQGRAQTDSKVTCSRETLDRAMKIFKRIEKKGYGFRLVLGHNINRKHWVDEQSEIFQCLIGQDKILIDSKGYVSYCAALKQRPIGNVADHSLAYFWHSHPAVKQYRSFFEKGYEQMTGYCQNCSFLSQCKGWCLAQRIHTYQDMMQGPDPLCRFYKK